MKDSNQLVLMKGTQEGITVYLDDDCSFDRLLNELETKLEVSTDEDRTELILHSQYRYLRENQEIEIRDMIEKNSSYRIKRFESYVLSSDEAAQQIDDMTVKPAIKNIRSGQVHQVDGDALILGDVNPGGLVMASGNIYIFGKLKGIAHAGSKGNKECVIVASYMNPSQLRIANKISRAPDYEVEGSDREFAYINLENDMIEVEKVNYLPRVRPNLIDRLERGIENG